MVSNVKGFQIPLVTTSERLSLPIPPATSVPIGFKVFDTDLKKTFITQNGGPEPAWSELQDNESRVVELGASGTLVSINNIGAINIPGIANATYGINFTSSADFVRQGQPITILQTESGATHPIEIKSDASVTINGISNFGTTLTNRGDTATIVNIDENQYFLQINNNQQQTMQTVYDASQGAVSNVELKEAPDGGITWSSYEKSIIFAPIPASQGTGYSVDDILTPSGGVAIVDAKIKVNTIGLSGEVLTFSLVDSGLYTTIPTPMINNTLTGGSGNGFQITLTAEQGGNVFMSPGSSQALDLSLCAHSALVTPHVPTTQQDFLNTTEGGILWDPNSKIHRYSDGVTIKNLGITGLTEGAVLFGSDSGTLDESEETFHFDKNQSSLSIGSKLQSVSINNVNKIPKNSIHGTGDLVGYTQVNYAEETNTKNQCYFLKARGTQSQEAKIEVGDEILTTFYGGWDGAAVNPTFSSGLIFQALVDDVVNNGSVPVSATWISSNLNAGTSSSFGLNSDGSIDFNVDGSVEIRKTATPTEIAKINPEIGYGIGVDNLNINVEGFQVNTKFNASQDAGSSIVGLQTYSDALIDTNTIANIRAGGTKATPTGAQDGMVIGQWIFAPKTTGANFNQSGYLQVRAFGNATATAAPTLFNWSFSNADAGTSNNLTVQPDGTVEWASSGGTERKINLDFEDQINLNTSSLTINSGNALDAIAPTANKGDIIAHNGSINASLSVGANGQVPTADSTAPTGLSYQIPSSQIFSKILPYTTVTNTTAETSVLGNIAGSNILLANSIRLGDTFSVIVTGSLRTHISNKTITLTVKIGGSAVAGVNLLVLENTSSLQYFEIEVDNITFVTVGAGAQIESGAQFGYKDTSGALTLNSVDMSLSNDGIDTTVNNTIDITAKWAVAEADNQFMVKTISFVKK